ncbi:MAG: RagB/SusD family nutrient uptake outer membrane protein, partial [Cytophagales bacterium]|nr:RagB/SusD family nutrient uptake outer membrane protein [Cytophagales bacterium]
NQVRQRAANEEGFVRNPDGTPAANYKIGVYPSFPSKEFALQAIQFERKLELAMEGHRHFDLVRWGIAAPVLNAYIAGEVNNIPHLQGATFDANKDEYYPKPANYVSRMPNVRQTQGY